MVILTQDPTEKSKARVKAFNKMLEDYMKGAPIRDTEWTRVGRPRAVSEKVLAAVEQEIEQNGSGGSCEKKRLVHRE
jgi:hypothetical protein